jgi:hypothetical protein
MTGKLGSGCPACMRYALYALLGYAALNLVFLLAMLPLGAVTAEG